MYNPILFPYCCIHHHQCFLCRQNICRKFLFLANCFKMQNMPKNSSKSSSLKVYDHHPILFSHCCICRHERTCFMQIKYVCNFFGKLVGCCTKICKKGHAKKSTLNGYNPTQPLLFSIPAFICSTAFCIQRSFFV